MTKYNARDILAMSKEAVWKLDSPQQQSITVVFDDGEVETTVRRTIFSRYLWKLHEHYPKLPLVKRHHMGMQRISTGLYLGIMSTIYKDWFLTYRDTPEYIPPSAWKLIYQVSNDIYNDMTRELDAYVATLSILDFLEVDRTPAIFEANNTVQPTQASIDANTDIVIKELRENPNLRHNNIASALRSQLLDPKQTIQCVGYRGFVTEISSMIYGTPITVGFSRGMRKLYDSMIESRMASKALMFAKDPLAICEYFNRKLQQVCQVVMHLHRGDCGTTHLMEWKVEASELKVMEGIHYVEEGQLKTIAANDKSLIGRTLHLRTPFGCVHPDRQTVCEVCFGELAHSIPLGTAPGHVSAISIGEKISQLVLSTKHVDGSSKVDDIDLGEEYASYLTTGAENNTLRIAPEQKGKKIQLVVSQERARNLPDIYGIANFIDMPVSRICQITEMSEVVMLIEDESEVDGTRRVTVPVSMGSRLGSLTGELLQYLRDNRPTLDERGDYVIDLSAWDHNKALFVLPLKHVNMLDYQDMVEKAIMSTDKKTGLAKHTNAAKAVKELLALISSKMSISLSHVMTVAYATTAVDAKNYDYRLPRGGESFTFCSIRDLMDYRSLGVKMAYQGQEASFKMPETYVIKNRPASPLDELLMG